jgi:16S rRNA (adenine1518-N6/adenine1519-N6)-dimethyltransferase
MCAIFELFPFFLGRYTRANIPYNITGAIIEKFLSTSFQPEMMVLMVQKEVAERIIAKDKKTGGLGKESILSIAIKVYGTPTYICTVKAGSFMPAPSIDSAVIKISDISRKNFINKHHEEVFFQIMKAGFAHKRKILSGNLKNILEPDMVHESFKQASLDSSIRAEDLTIIDWLNLSKIVYNNQYGTTAS